VCVWLCRCIVLNAHNTVFGLKCSAICAQAVYFLYSTRPSVAWLYSRWWLAACDWLLSVLSTHIRRVWKIWEYILCTDCTGQDCTDFALISTVKMETRNLVEGYFGSEFPAICNHCGVMAAWSCKTLKIFEKFLRKIFQILFRKFSSWHRSTCLFKFYEIWPMGNRWNRALLTWQKKIRLALQLSLLRGLGPKSARASPQQCTQGAPDFIQIGSLSAEL